MSPFSGPVVFTTVKNHLLSTCQATSLLRAAANPKCWPPAAGSELGVGDMVSDRKSTKYPQILLANISNVEVQGVEKCFNLKRMKFWPQSFVLKSSFRQTSKPLEIPYI